MATETVTACMGARGIGLYEVYATKTVSINLALHLRRFGLGPVQNRRQRKCLNWIRTENGIMQFFRLC